MKTINDILVENFRFDNHNLCYQINIRFAKRSMIILKPKQLEIYVNKYIQSRMIIYRALPVCLPSGGEPTGRHVYIKYKQKKINT